MSNSLALGNMNNKTGGVPVKVYTFITEGIMNLKKQKALIKMLFMMS